ncbi:hypothetical protein Tco_0742586 [Tanacetum coccineum]
MLRILGAQAYTSACERDKVEEKLHTLGHSTNGESIFATHSQKQPMAVIPVEMENASLRSLDGFKNKNDEGLLLNLDLLEEKRELAATVEEKHKRKM